MKHCIIDFEKPQYNKEECSAAVERQVTNAIFAARRSRLDPRRPSGRKSDLLESDRDVHVCSRANNPRYRASTLDAVVEVSSENGCSDEFTVADNLSLGTFNKSCSDLLASPAELIQFGEKANKSALLEGLRTLMSRLQRQNECHKAQLSRNLALKQQVDQLSGEIDASVDALRHQQTILEHERLRSVLETRDLRKQLAEAVALLEQSKVDDTFRQHLKRNCAVAPDSNGRAVSDEMCSQCQSQPLEVLTLRVTVDKLETELARQKSTNEKETARLRGQLAETSADARVMRLRLARLSSASLRSSSPPYSESMPQHQLEPTSSPCLNCARLQRLVDVLQAKATLPTAQITPMECVASPQPELSEVRVTPDIISECSKEPVSLFITSVDLPNVQVQTDLVPLKEVGCQAESSTTFFELTNEPEPSAHGLTMPLQSSAQFYPKEPILPSPPTYVDRPRSPPSLFDLLQAGRLNLKSPPANGVMAILDNCIPTTEVSNGKSAIALRDVPDVWRSKDNPIPHSNFFHLLGEQDPPFVDLSEACPGSSEEILQHPVVRFLNQQVASQHELISKLKAVLSITERKTDPSNPAIVSPPDIERLQERLRVLEDEVESSADQLKASNIEFLQLRERLSSVTVERAHLKETVDCLDDQVTQLESTLFERSQELRICRSRLALIEGTSEQLSTGNSTSDSSAAHFASDLIETDLMSVTIASLTSQAIDLPSVVPSVSQSNQNQECCSNQPVTRSTFRSPKLNVLCGKLHSVLQGAQPYSTKVFVAFNTSADLIAKKASSVHDCIGQPLSKATDIIFMLGNRFFGRRPSLLLIVGLVAYLAFLHVLLFNCWLQ